ncbi:MAG: enoyl-CoA hydratase/isomerase family protein, partial [Acidobacteriota bacterium]|nr:enoyl-CoA hydratase/isomerase family protein [Acidobacteriota bacterium]
MSEPILFEIHDRLGILTLNRPDKLNALVPDMRAGFEEALAKSAEPGVKALILRAAGKAFSVGGDIGWMIQCLREGRQADMDDLLNLGSQVAYGLLTLPKPVVAVVQGAAAGGGMGLALSADLRLATPDLVFSMAFVKIALHPDWGSSVALGRLLNPALAAELMLTGDRVDASRALALGLVNRVVPADQMEAAVEALGRQLAAGPAATFSAIKASVLRNQGYEAPRLKALLET